MIRASLILAIAWCASRLLKNRPAAERHLLWVLALAAAALLPVLTWIVPAWRPEVAARVARALPALSQASAVQHAQHAGGAIVHAVGIEPDGGMESILLTIWLAGAFVALGLLLPGARMIRRLTAQSHLLSTPEWMQAGLRRTVRLLLCRGGSLPLTWGVLRPQVLLPADAVAWPESRRFSVLAHELAHIRRCDWLFQILAEVACALYWFHPLFWIARNRLHLESERACDDAVLNLGVEGKEYAQHLLDVARSLKRKEPVWSLAMAGQLHLERRLIAVLSTGTNRCAVRWKAFGTIVLALLCCVLPLAALRAPVAANTTPQVIQYTMPPLYSDQARDQRIEGVVKIAARVDSYGRARDLRVVRGLGFGLDENALLAVRSWQFTPGGRADSVTQVDVEFNLRNAELNEIIANDMVTSVGPDVTPPRIVRRVEARYPRTATDQQRKETVLLDAVFQENGIPKVLRVVRSLSWEMDEAAIAALEQWRFSPAQMITLVPDDPLRRDSRVFQRVPVPVKVRMNIEMAFVAPAN